MYKAFLEVGICAETFSDGSRGCDAELGLRLGCRGERYRGGGPPGLEPATPGPAVGRSAPELRPRRGAAGEGVWREEMAQGQRAGLGTGRPPVLTPAPGAAGGHGTPQGSVNAALQARFARNTVSQRGRHPHVIVIRTPWQTCPMNYVLFQLTPRIPRHFLGIESTNLI